MEKCVMYSLKTINVYFIWAPFLYRLVPNLVTGVEGEERSRRELEAKVREATSVALVPHVSSKASTAQKVSQRRNPRLDH